MIPAPQLDPTSEVPLYKQLYGQFRAWIESGRLAEGERLPSTRTLAGLLGLNRATVAACYSLLESDGLIHGHVGRGSYVTAQGRAPKRTLDWEAVLGSADPMAPGAAFPAAHGSVRISFATARPSEELFPVERVREACQAVLSGPQAASILQLGSPHGYGPLREYLLGEARREGLARAGDDLLITSGCQQALDLVQRAMVRAGDTVLVEDPVYPGVRNLFQRAGARLVGLPVGRQGIELEAFESALERERPRLVVLTPNFQNPTGATLPAEVRRAIVARAGRAGAAVVENDIYGELRYEGTAAPPLKQMDESGAVVLLRSFSKVTFPGLRVGWLLGPRPLIDRVAEYKQLTDLHTDHLSQAVLLRFVESGDFAAHRRRVLAAGAERLAAVLEACGRFLPPGTEFTRPQGGMNLWVRLPAPLDAAELLARSEREGVSYTPGKYFEVSRRQPGGLRLSFGGLDPAQIREGVEALGRVFGSELERARAVGALGPAPAMV